MLSRLVVPAAAWPSCESDDLRLRPTTALPSSPTICCASRSIACCCDVATDWPASGMRLRRLADGDQLRRHRRSTCTGTIGCRRRLSQVTSARSSVSETRGSSNAFSTSVRRVSPSKRAERMLSASGVLDDFVRRLELDFLDDRFGEPLAQIAAIAVRLDHRHVDGGDVGRVERAGADLVADAAGEHQQANARIAKSQIAQMQIAAIDRLELCNLQFAVRMLAIVLRCYRCCRLAVGVPAFAAVVPLVSALRPAACRRFAIRESAPRATARGFPGTDRRTRPSRFGGLSGSPSISATRSRDFRGQLRIGILLDHLGVVDAAPRRSASCRRSSSAIR